MAVACSSGGFWLGVALSLTQLPLSCAILLLKLLRDTDERSVSDLLLDASKLLIGFVATLLFNALSSAVLAACAWYPDRCAWYALLLVCDSTLGVTWNSAMLRWMTWAVNSFQGNTRTSQRFFSGNYNGGLSNMFDLHDAECLKKYGMMLAAWVAVLLNTKVMTFTFLCVCEFTLSGFDLHLPSLVTTKSGLEIPAATQILPTFLYAAQAWYFDEQLLFAKKAKGIMDLTTAEQRVCRKAAAAHRTALWLLQELKLFSLELDDEEEKQLQKLSEKKRQQGGTEPAPIQEGMDGLQYTQEPREETYNKMVDCCAYLDTILSSRPAKGTAEPRRSGMEQPLLPKARARRWVGNLCDTYSDLMHRWKGNSKKVMILLSVSMATSCVLMASGRMAGCYALSSSEVKMQSGLVTSINAESDLEQQVHRHGTYSLPAFHFNKQNHWFSFNALQSQVLDLPWRIQGDFTIAFWMRTKATSRDCSSQGHADWFYGCGLFDGHSAAGADDFGISLSDGDLRFGVSRDHPGQHQTINATGVADGKWHAITALRSAVSGTFSLYVDGAQRSSGIGTTAALNASATLTVGRSTLPLVPYQYSCGLLDLSTCTGETYSWLTGDLSDMRVYNRVLSEKEVQEFHQHQPLRLCAMAMPACLYKAMAWFWCVWTGHFNVWGTGQSEMVAYSELIARRWFDRLAPVRGLVRLLDATVGIESWPGIGPRLTTFASMSGAPVSLPHFEAGHSKSPMTPEQVWDRNVFWVAVLLLKVAFLILSTMLWYAFLIVLPPKLPLLVVKERIRTEHWSPDKVLTLFVFYHFTHNMFLFCVVNVSVVCGFVSEAAGLDWEMWILWIDWLIIFLNMTAVIKYWANFGSKLRDSCNDIVMLLTPGFGNDIHLAKDWVFVGLCFQQALLNENPAKECFAYFLAVASILSLFLPLPELLSSKADARSFISSHWPILMAIPRADLLPEARANQVTRRTWSRTGIQTNLVEIKEVMGVWWTRFILTKANAQTTKAKQVVAEQNELPQAIFEVLYMSVFGFSLFLVLAVLFSALKVALIPAGRIVVVRWLARLGEPNDLVRFVQEHMDVSEFEHQSTALHLAAGSGKLSDGGKHNYGLHRAVPMLIQTKMVDESINRENGKRLTPLLVALRYSPDAETAMKVILSLVEAKANLDDERVSAELASRTASFAAPKDGLDVFCENLRDFRANSGSSVHQDPLLYAAGKNDVEFFKQLVLAGANLDVRSKEDGSTPLHFAVRNTDSGTEMTQHLSLSGTEMTRHLITVRADVLAVDNERRTALHVAVRSNKAAVCKCMLQELAELSVGQVGKPANLVQALLDKRDPVGATALHYAALVSSEVCDALCEQAKLASLSTQELLEKEDRNRWTPLRWAVATHGLPMERSSAANAAVICLVLVKHGAEITKEVLDAASRLQSEVSNALKNMPCAEGADPPLIAAVRQQDHRLTQLLLDERADLNGQRDASGMTALHIAAKEGYTPYCEQLVRCFASIAARTPEDKNPLHFAAEMDRADICQLLCAFGGEIHNADSAGMTPLDLAAQKGHESVCGVLVGFNDISPVRNALYHALRAGLPRICRQLCERLTSAGGGLNEAVASPPGHASAGTLLHVAVGLCKDSAASARQQCCQLLVEHRASLTAQRQDAQGQQVSPLDEAGPEVLTKLVNEWSTEPGIPPLLVASQEGASCSLVQVLLSKRAEVNKRARAEDLDGDLSFQRNGSITTTALHVAACKGNVDVCHLLLSHGAEVACHGQTPLHAAVVRKQTPTERRKGVCTAILAAKGSAGARDENDRPALQSHLCSSLCDVDTGRLLLENMTEDDLKRFDAGGSTVLHSLAYAATRTTTRTSARSSYCSLACEIISKCPDLVSEQGGIHKTPPDMSPSWLTDSIVKSKGPGGKPLLWRAVEKKKKKQCEQLLKCRANANEIFAEKSALQLAVETRFEDGWKMLLKSYADPNVRSRDGQPLLAVVVEMANEELRDLLIRHGADVNVICAGKPLIHAAVANRDQTLCHLLVQHRADVNLKHADVPPLALAMQSGSVNVGDLLCRSNADVNDTLKGVPLLHSAVKGRKSLWCNLLLSYRASPDRISDGSAPLHLAVQTEQLDLSKILVERRADVNLKVEREPEYPLLMAARTGNKGLSQLIVSARADLRQTSNGKTVLQWAPEKSDAHEFLDKVMTPAMHAAAMNSKAKRDSEYSHLQNMLRSIRPEQKKEGFFLRDLAGRTALHCAAAKNRGHICGLLIEEFNFSAMHPHHGPSWSWYYRQYYPLYSDPFDDLLEKDSSGQTPLHVAAAAGNLDACRALLHKELPRLNKKYDVLTAMDDDFQSALALAVLNGHWEVSRELEGWHLDRQSQGPGTNAVRVVLPGCLDSRSQLHGLEVDDAPDGTVIKSIRPGMGADRWNQHCLEYRKPEWRIEVGQQVSWCNTHTVPNMIAGEFRRTSVKTLILDVRIKAAAAARQQGKVHSKAKVAPVRVQAPPDLAVKRATLGQVGTDAATSESAQPPQDSAENASPAPARPEAKVAVGNGNSHASEDTGDAEPTDCKGTDSPDAEPTPEVARGGAGAATSKSVQLEAEAGEAGTALPHARGEEELQEGPQDQVVPS